MANERERERDGVAADRGLLSVYAAGVGTKNLRGHLCLYFRTPGPREGGWVSSRVMVPSTARSAGVFIERSDVHAKNSTGTALSS